MTTLRPQRPLPFLQNGVAQIAAIVEDLDQSVETYWKVFGIGPWHFYTYRRPLVRQMSYRAEPASYQMRLALSYVGPMRIELIEHADDSGPSIYRDFVEEHGYGLHHLGLLVDDMEAALAQARAAGYQVIQDGSGFGLDGDGHYAYLSTEDDLGLILELIERPTRRHPPEKIYPPPEED